MPKGNIAGDAPIPFKREKGARVIKAVNGYVVFTDNTDNYEQSSHVAKDVSEVACIIETYFA